MMKYQDLRETIAAFDSDDCNKNVLTLCGEKLTQTGGR